MITLNDIIEEWLFEKFPRYRLTQNRFYSNLWAIRDSRGVIAVRINTQTNGVHADGRELSPHDPNFFNELEKVLRL